MSRLPPMVTGLSPKEGPPGTRIVIRGENLGTSAYDLISINVCGAECIFQTVWQNPSRILCRSGNGIGLGDVVVTTKSGGSGTCTVQFRGYMDAVGPTKESAVWVDDSRFDAGAKNQNPPPTSLVESEDPLALSDEQGACIMTEDELIEKFPEGSGNMAQENFLPAWYLLQNHSGASFEDLRQGLRHMQSQVKHQSTGPVLFLKAHLGSYFECIDTLDNLQVRLAEDSNRFLEDAGSLINKVSTARDITDRTFDEIFKRRKKVEFYHSCSNTVQRFRYLFNLLANAHKHIRNRQYRAIMDDYKKLQQTLGKSASPVLQNAFKEIERKIEVLRSELREELKVLPGTAAEQLHICRSLVELGDESDAQWELATDLQNFLKEQVLDNYTGAFSDAEAAKTRVLTAVQSREHPKLQFRVQFKRAGSGDGHASGDSVTNQLQYANLVKLISELFVEHIEHFWRISEAVADNTDRIDRPPTRIEQEKARLSLKMSMEAGALYVAVIRCLLGSRQVAFTPEEFYTAIAHVSNVRSVFRDRVDEEKLLGRLLVDMKRTFVVGALDHAISDLDAIMASGKDQPEVTMRIVTKFPEVFTAISVKTLSVTKPCLAGDDQEKHSSITNEPGFVQEIVNRWTKFLVAPSATFRDCAENGTSVVILFSLMSVHSLVNKILPRIFSALRNVLPNLPVKFYSSVSQLYGELLADLRSSFIEMKSVPVMGAIEKLMSDYGVDWKSSDEPKAVNAYITQIALDLNNVYEELTVFGDETGLVDEMMRGIIEKVTEELNRLFVVTIKFSPNGAFQGQLDIAAFREVIGKFRTQDTKKMLEELDALLSKFNDLSTRKEFTEIMTRFKDQNKTLFLAV